MMNRLRAYWDEFWRVPREDKIRVQGLLIVYAMLLLLLLWFVLSALGVEYRAVERVRGVLPTWFPNVNLFIAPVLVFFVAGPLLIRPVLRLGLSVVMLLSLSALYLSSRNHQGAYLFSLGLLSIEVFLVIPIWNKRAKRTRARGISDSNGIEATDIGIGDGSQAASLSVSKAKWKDLLLYIAVALAFAAVLVLYILTRS